MVTLVDGITHYENRKTTLCIPKKHSNTAIHQNVKVLLPGDSMGDDKMTNNAL